MAERLKISARQELVRKLIFRGAVLDDDVAILAAETIIRLSEQVHRLQRQAREQRASP